MEIFISNSYQQTLDIAKDIAKRLKQGDILAYRGGLGVGKTAFTTGLGIGLGIEQDICSPTFSLVNEYRTDKLFFVHFDMYRICDMDNLYCTGFFDYLDTDAILAIEWSENISGVLPDKTITVNIERTGEDQRRITIEGGGEF